MKLLGEKILCNLLSVNKYPINFYTSINWCIQDKKKCIIIYYNMSRDEI